MKVHSAWQLASSLEPQESTSDSLNVFQQTKLITQLGRAL
jgi:hypothetical protein